MAEVKVSGASDDLIEVEGALSEEFGGGGDPRFLHFNEGTVLKIRYGKGGVWKIEWERKGTAAVHILHKDVEDDDGYSDVATLTGDLTSVKCWGSVHGATTDDLEEAISGWLTESPERDIRGAELPKLLLLWEAIEALRG